MTTQPNRQYGIQLDDPFKCWVYETLIPAYSKLMGFKIPVESCWVSDMAHKDDISHMNISWLQDHDNGSCELNVSIPFRKTWYALEEHVFGLMRDHLVMKELLKLTRLKEEMVSTQKRIYELESMKEGK